MTAKARVRENPRPLHLEGAHHPVRARVVRVHVPPADRPDLRPHRPHHQQGCSGPPRSHDARLHLSGDPGPHHSHRLPAGDPDRVRPSLRRHGGRGAQGVRGEPAPPPLARGRLRGGRDGLDRVPDDRCRPQEQLRVQVPGVRDRPDPGDRGAQGARVQRHLRELRHLRGRDRFGPGGASERLRVRRAEARGAALHHGARRTAALGRREPPGHAAAPRWLHPRDQSHCAPEVPGSALRAVRHHPRAGEHAGQAGGYAEGRPRDDADRATSGHGRHHSAQGQPEPLLGGDPQEVRDPGGVPGLQRPGRAPGHPCPPGWALGRLRRALAHRALLLRRSDARREHRGHRADPALGRDVGTKRDRGRLGPLPAPGESQGASGAAGRADPEGLLGRGRVEPGSLAARRHGSGFTPCHGGRLAPGAWRASGGSTGATPSISSTDT